VLALDAFGDCPMATWPHCRSAYGFEMSGLPLARDQPGSPKCHTAASWWPAERLTFVPCRVTKMWVTPWSRANLTTVSATSLPWRIRVSICRPRAKLSWRSSRSRSGPVNSCKSGVPDTYTARQSALRRSATRRPRRISAALEGSGPTTSRSRSCPDRPAAVAVEGSGSSSQEHLEAAAPGCFSRHGQCGNTRTSMPSASRTSRSSGVPPRRARQPRRRLWPTKICVMP
jgi:hypothetical protein